MSPPRLVRWRGLVVPFPEVREKDCYRGNQHGYVRHELTLLSTPDRGGVR
jgi:hypothetical protein